MVLRKLLDILAAGIIVQLIFDDNANVRFTTSMCGEKEIFSESTLESDITSISIDSHGFLVLNLTRCEKSKRKADGAGKGHCCVSCKYYFGKHHLCVHGTSMVADSTQACNDYIPAEETHD